MFVIGVDIGRIRSTSASPEGFGRLLLSVRAPVLSLSFMYTGLAEDMARHEGTIFNCLKHDNLSARKQEAWFVSAGILLPPTAVSAGIVSDSCL